MRLSTLLLSAALALTFGLSGTVMADGDRGRGHERHERHERHDNDRHGGYRHGYRYRGDRNRHDSHRHGYRVYVPEYRYVTEYRYLPRPHDSWYGIHLFFGG